MVGGRTKTFGGFRSVEDFKEFVKNINEADKELDKLIEEGLV